MDTSQIILAVVLGAVALAILWAVIPKKKLPPARPREALEPAEEEGEKEEGEERGEAEAPAEEAEAPAEEAEAPVEEAEAPVEEAEAPAAEEEEEIAREPEAGAPEAPETPFEEAAEPSVPEEEPKKPEVPRFAPPPTFAPPPSIKKKPKPEVKKPQPEPEPAVKKPEPEAKKPAPEAEKPAPEVKKPAPEVKKPAPEVKKPAPEAEKPAPEAEKPEPARAPVPIPVDKPRVPTREEREKAALEAKKNERERYSRGFKKTKRGFIAKLARLFKGKPKVSDDLKDDVEEVLFTADIGAKTAEALLEAVTGELDKREVADPDAVWGVIRRKALEILDIEAPKLDYAPEVGPYTLLMIGVNGVGKTTTLGKLAARHIEAGRKTLLVAGDTFRAAAGEQLEVWARRVGCDIHLGKEGADPSSVIFDGITRGRAEGYDVVLCDTAGRLHTRKELMDELQKMGRAASKALSKGRDPLEPHDTFLVLDGTIGQNALAQAQMFKEAMNFTGLVVTKLDGTAKGGVVLGVVDELKVPIRYIGIGEGVDDLRRFDPEAYCEVLFQPDEANSDDANEGGGA